MKGNGLIICAILAVLVFSACAANPGPVSPPAAAAAEPGPVEPVVPDDPVPEVEVKTEPVPVAEEPFDPSSITKEVFDTTKTEVQALIEELNTIIRAQNFDAWSDYLGADYFATLSDPAFLARISESARLKNQKIVLQDLKGYFIHVVVPSRANDRVDDIEFIGQKRVKAFTLTAKAQRLRLYDLERTEQGWKIVN